MGRALGALWGRARSVRRSPRRLPCASASCAQSQSAATVVSASVLAISPSSLPICMRRSAGDVHTETPGASDALRTQEGDGVKGGPLEVACGLLDDLEGVVAAPVEDQDHLVAAGGHVELGAQRMQAGCDVRRLVASGYDDDRLAGRGAGPARHGRLALALVGLRWLGVHGGLSPAAISWRPCS